VRPRGTDPLGRVVWGEAADATRSFGDPGRVDAHWCAPQALVVGSVCHPVGPLAQSAEHLPFNNATHNQARSTKPHNVNEIQSASASYHSRGRSTLRTFQALWRPQRDFQSGNTGNAG